MGETNTEHIVCHDGGCNAATMAALMNNKQSDTAMWASLMNNSNSWNNNPFIWLVFLAWMNGGMFGNRGNAEAENFNSRQIAALQDSVNTNHNNDMALQAINGNREALGQLAQTFNCDINQIQQAVCGVKSAIEQVGGAVGYTGESVKNAIALGDANIMQQMQQCCCQTKTAIIEQGYQGQLATERQTNVLGSQMAANHSADQLQSCQNQGALVSRIDQLANGIQTGFAQVGFQSQQNTQAIINNATANTQRILDQMCANTTQQLRDSIAEKDRQLQTANIISGLKANGCNCGC